MRQIVIFIFCIALPLSANTNTSYGVDLDLNAYYSSLGGYFNFRGEPRSFLVDEQEYKIYKELFLHSLVPHFALFEVSLNPLPSLGVATRYYWSEFYQKMNIFEGLNLIKTITIGFEEPGALSFFLGNLVNFTPREKRKKWNGKGYAGYLVSVGPYHIKDNILIEDRWIEIEWKIKGDRRTDIKKMSWSYRIGAKLHQNVDIKDIFFLGLKRDRTDFNDRSISIFRNSSFQYRMDFSLQDLRVIMVKILVGKKFPIILNKVACGIEFGFLWENTDKYTGQLTRNYSVDENFQMIIQPQLKF